jgi:hypothetical protein
VYFGDVWSRYKGGFTGSITAIEISEVLSTIGCCSESLFELDASFPNLAVSHHIFSIGEVNFKRLLLVNFGDFLTFDSLLFGLEMLKFSHFLLLT